MSQCFTEISLGMSPQRKGQEPWVNTVFYSLVGSFSASSFSTRSSVQRMVLPIVERALINQLTMNKALNRCAHRPILSYSLSGKTP